MRALLIREDFEQRVKLSWVLCKSELVGGHGEGVSRERTTHKQYHPTTLYEYEYIPFFLPSLCLESKISSFR
jgi:hypothetical protein